VLRNKTLPIPEEA